MRKCLKALLGISLGIGCLTGCMSLPETAGSASGDADKPLNLVQTQEPKDGQDMAVIKTSVGDIDVLLYEEYAPNTVKHFKKLVESGFYNNREIFLITDEIKAFLTGASNDNGSEGELMTENGKKIQAEVDPDIWHFSGAVSAYGVEEGFINKKYMSDSRFFILGDIPAQQDFIEKMEENDYPEEVITAYKQLGGMPNYTGYYTVFGQVISGMDLVEDIVNSDFDEETGKPLDKIVIESITLTQYSSDNTET